MHNDVCIIKGDNKILAGGPVFPFLRSLVRKNEFFQDLTVPNLVFPELGMYLLEWGLHH